MYDRRADPKDKTRATPGRRTVNRDSLFLSATIRKVGQEGELLPLRVRNLSAVGLMADYQELAAVGEPVIVTVRGIGSVSGTVAWVRRGRIGITFDVEVDPLKARTPIAGGTASVEVRQRPL